MKPFRSFAALCSALLLAFVLGCSAEKAPTAAPPAPDLSLVGDLAGTVTDLAGGVLPIKGLLACNVTQTYSTTREIGPRGGTIQVGPHSLFIPENALSATTSISATAPAGKVVEVEFQPHGLEFKKKTTLTMSYRDCGLLSALPQIVYVDDNQNILEQLLSLPDLLRRTVSARTDHFSSYILAER